MKIIKKGIKNSMEVTCKICKAVLEIESSDLIAQGSSIPPTLFLFTCPDCKRNNEIYAIDLTDDLRSEISQKFK